MTKARPTVNPVASESPAPSQAILLLPLDVPVLEVQHVLIWSNGNRTAVRGLGEIALRVNNLDTMQKFYEEVIGLPLMTRVPNCAFFKIADGYGGHTQVLPLFDRAQTSGYRGTDATTSTIDHIAFEIALTDFADERKRLEALGLQIEIAEHAWVRWRSLYVTDPEGNQVELVCYDSSL